jgi:hypothetical protein
VLQLKLHSLPKKPALSHNTTFSSRTGCFEEVNT